MLGEVYLHIHKGLAGSLHPRRPVLNCILEAQVVEVEVAEELLRGELCANIFADTDGGITTTDHGLAVEPFEELVLK